MKEKKEENEILEILQDEIEEFWNLETQVKLQINEVYLSNIQKSNIGINNFYIA